MISINAARPRPLRVLYVEDHPDVGGLIVRFLKGEGHEVYWAQSVAYAINLARAAAFDVLLTDSSLPDGTGADVLEALTPLPGVLITAYDRDAIDARQRCGFRSCLQKPVEFPALLKALAEAAG